jgi:hypothetical protein
MKVSYPTLFNIVEDMYTVLEELFTDPREVEKAKDDF